MATITVTTALDLVDAGDGRLSLREAVAQANATTAADTIVFAAGLETQILTLTGGELVIGRDLTIDGDQNNDGLEVALSGGDTQRLLRSSGTGTDLTLQDLTLVDGHVGYSARGAGVFAGSGTSVTLDGATVANCVADHSTGGGIYAESGSRVAVLASTLSDNRADYGIGGAIATGGDVTLVIRNSRLEGNTAYAAAGAISMSGGHLTIEGSTLTGNSASGEDFANGGAMEIINTAANIARSSIINNYANDGGGIFASGGYLSIDNSTVAANTVGGDSAIGGGIYADGSLVVRNSTITGNINHYTYDGRGGGIWGSSIDIANSIVVGNSAAYDADVSGTIVRSNGHNLFGSDAVGNVAGDREFVSPYAVFAAVDPATGGGLVGLTGIATLLNSAANPASSGADLLLAADVGQLGSTGRPLPATSLPDIGSVEIAFAVSTTATNNNDVLTGTNAANTISGRDGADLISGLNGADTLNGGAGGDLLDGGTGNDKLNGDAGIDIVRYAGTAKVTIDLRGDAAGDTDTAVRGSERDTLTGIEGAIGSAAADVFYGDSLDNYFRGQNGKDTFTGGAGRDLYDYGDTAASPVGTGRDVITDFAHLGDKIDLMSVDADGAIAGDQAFTWVGAAALTGPGEVGYYHAGGNTVIRASTDADAAAELEIQLTGIKTLTTADFYL